MTQFSSILLYQIILEEGSIYLIFILLVLYQIDVCHKWYLESLRMKYLSQNNITIEHQKMKMLRSSTIYNVFKNAKGNRSEEEWKELSYTLNVIYDGFSNRLRNVHDFTDIELRICLLIKMNLSPSEMAIITNHSRESISATRRRLYEKVFKKKGKPKFWDKYIMSL